MSNHQFDAFKRGLSREASIDISSLPVFEIFLASPAGLFRLRDFPFFPFFNRDLLSGFSIKI